MLKYIYCGLFALIFCSCNEDKEQNSEGQKKIPFLTLNDELGRSIELDSIPQRILPLCASSMEFLTLLCDSSQIVGRTADIASPEWLKLKPVVGNFPLDIEKVLSLKPDLVVSKEGIVSIEQVNKLESLGLNVYMQKANSIQDIMDGLSKLALVLGREEKGTLQAKLLQKQFDSLKKESVLVKQSALVFISTDPLYVFGYKSYLSDVLATVGLYNAVDTTITQLYPMVDQEYVLKINPDYLILPRSLEGSNSLFSKYPLLKKTKAFQKQQYIYVNDDWLSRPSPNIVKAAAYILNERKAHEEK